MNRILAAIFGVLAVVCFAYPAFADQAAACPEAALTPLQKFAGLITFGNITITAGILGTVGFLVWVLYLINIPAALYEIGGYAISLSLIFFAKNIPLGIDPIFMAFAGCIGFAAMLLVSAVLHNFEDSEAGYCATLTAIFTLVSLAYQSELIGFFAVLALFGALGFFVESYPFVTVIGFKDDDALNRATGTALILLVIFVVYRASGVSVSYARLFSYGVYLIGSIVAFTGFLILAYEGYERNSYFGRQLPIIIGGISAIFFGSLFAIPEIQKIGGTFFGLYLLEKICDIRTRDTVGYALKGLTISAVALVAGYVILRYQDFFAQYILFM